MSNTYTSDNNTGMTIIAKLNSSNVVQLFLVENLVILTEEDEADDEFGYQTTNTNVTVRVISTDNTVTVTNNNGGGPTWNSGSTPADGVTFYWSIAQFPIPTSQGNFSDSFSIQVGSYSADPTVVITRGGSGNNVALSTTGG
jgi:hypothetical protein